MKKNHLSKTCSIAIVFFLLIVLGSFKESLAAADDFPSKPIEYVVGWPPGGGGDIVSRVVAEKANKYLEGKGKLYVTNKPGGSGVVGFNYVVKSKADGYTIGTLHGSNTYISLQFPEHSPYAMNDFEPICLFAKSFIILAIREESPIKRYEDLVAYMKKNPGSLTCATYGKTSTPNVYLELLNLKEKIDIRGIPFSGAAPAALALLGGHVDMAIASEPTLGSHHRAGKLRFLLLFDESPTYPNIPTAKAKGLDVPFVLNGCGVPTGVPRERFNTLHDLFAKAMRDPETIEKLRKAGEVPSYLNSKQFKDVIVSGFQTVELIKDKLK